MRPPTDIEPSELFQKLLNATPPSEVIDFPRRDPVTGKAVDQIRIQVIGQEEMDRARIDATEKLRARGITDAQMTSPAIKEVLADAVGKELIAMCCLTVKGGGDPERPLYARIFRDANDVSKLRPNEILVLFNAHLLVQEKYGPFESNLSKEDVDAWVTRLGAGASEFPLLELALPQLVLLAHSLAERLFTLSHILGSQRESLPNTLASALENYVTDTTSAGLPADASTAITSEPKGSRAEPMTLEQATELAGKLRERG